MVDSLLVTTLLERLASHDQTSPAVYDEAGVATFGDIDTGARRVAAALLAELGALEGKRVGVFASPGRHFLHAVLGVLHAGGCVLVLSPLHPEAESRYFCDDADVAAIVVTPDLAARAEGLSAGRAVLDVTALTGAGEQLEVSRARGEDDAIMLYTSGTTGKPKGALLPHASLAAQTAILRDLWAFGPHDVLLHALPLHHMHGLCIALFTALGAGAAARMMPAWDALRVWESMRDATVFMAVPTMYAKLFQAFDAAAPDARARFAAHARALRLAASGSAALPVSLAERWRAVAGCIPLERFGMTEIGVGLSNPLDPRERRAGCVGLPPPSVEARIVGDSGEDAPTGELWIRGPSVFRGYHRREEATREAFAAGGWFKTGDTVTREEDGAYRILGRTSVDILKSGGYKLSALEIEEALRDHPAVGEVAVIGLPDETWGERVVACVVRRAEVTGPELRAFAKERLAAYKCPKQVVFLDDLPKNAMGKVQKPALARLVAGVASD